MVTEQVSHHPPITALHAEAEKWVFWEEYRLDIKFRGQVSGRGWGRVGLQACSMYSVVVYFLHLPPPQWLRVQPEGVVHFRTKADGYHYSWKKPHTTVHNLILGSLWADHVSSFVTATTFCFEWCYQVVLINQSV